MEEKFYHTVLVVDDDEAVVKCIGSRLTEIGVTVVPASGGEEGLEKIQAARKPFSLIIADQGMPGMQGHEFLEKARQLTPDSVRFLVTGEPTMDVIMAAVNRGAIYRYISKPLNTDGFLNTVRSGLLKYEVILENERLLDLAKAQNAKLYMFNCDLKDKAESHQKRLEALDREIKEQTLDGQGAGAENKEQKPQPLEALQDIFRKNNLLTQEKMEGFYKELMGQLYMGFQDIAVKNGFSMPEAIDGGS